MFTVKNNSEFLDDIKRIDPCLKNIRISAIEISKKESTIKYCFICDKAVDNTIANRILEYVQKISSPVFSEVSVDIKKIVSDSELINDAIYKYLNENYPSISIFLKPTDIYCTEVGSVVKYVVKLTADGVKYVTMNGSLNKLNEYLSKKFCSDFVGSTQIKEVDESIDIAEDDVYVQEIQKIEYRTIKVTDVTVIDDANMGNLAVYLEDAVSGNVVVCGTITDITERETKNGKPFFIIRLDDTTGKLGGVYFTKKTTYPKIKELAIGDAIICRGGFSEYNGRQSFTIDGINRCVFPSDFIKKERYKKQPPKEYRLVKPSEASTIKVASVFDETISLSQEVLDTTYVVFDLETTGLDVMNNGITEIGAVKIKNGKIVEQFTTLVNPDYPITQEIIKITGITPEMVKDSPKINAVLPDFLKFIEGVTLVAHNAEFDTKFIKRFANAEEYEINNKVLDTMEISRKVLPQLRRNDLHTLADHFGIVFHHHRALSDAYATAECFLKLLAIQCK